MVRTVKRLLTVDLKLETPIAINAPGRHPVITLKAKTQ
jgi:hypothetical protein